MKWYPNKERGQVLVLFSLMLVVFIGVLALVLDGGMGYLYRRQAQNAADAGALAAASIYCGNTFNAAMARTEAERYATVHNRATSALVTIDTVTKEIRVTASVEGDTFFGSIFNIDRMNATASASARCFTPVYGKGMLPMAYFCQDYKPGSQSKDCGVAFGEGNEVVFGNSEPDSKDCGITINCVDLNGDGITDNFYDSSSRGWIDLSGDGDQIKSVIANGYNGPAVYPKLWVKESSGAMTVAFSEIQTLLTNAKAGSPPRNYVEFYVPVFDKFCADWPDTINKCLQPGDDVRAKTGKGDFYRIAGVAKFRVTCVRDDNKDVCPIALKAGYTQENNKVKTIEGYFVTDADESDLELGTGGVDFGLYLIRLSK
jgi:Flp pilus assembly protein TadG